MSHRPALTALLASALIAGCADQPAAPRDPLVPALSPDFMNNPDNGNIRIVRYQDHVAISWTDPQTGLRATHTSFPIPFQGRPETDCGPQAQLDPLSVQEAGLLVDPWFESQLRRVMTGDVFIIVRDTRQAGACYGNALVAEGVGRFHYTDNDAFGVGPEANNANAWGFRASGALATAGGGRAQYAGHLQFTVMQDRGLVQSHAQVIVR